MNQATLPPLVVVGGATATGKSVLALAVAERLGGLEIVSADSRQVYRGMDVGTAKATAGERHRVQHHGLDLVEPDERFTAADYRRHALEALSGIASRGHAALLVGGTGLYLRVVARGIPVEEGGEDPGLRLELETRLRTAGLALLVKDLRRIAPGLATRTDLSNQRRVVRALERATLLGDRPPPEPVGYPGPTLWLGLTVEPPEHRRRIAERAHAQFHGGLLAEAAELQHRYSPDLPALSAVGYREAMAHLHGELSLEDAIERTVSRTWAYARRQKTWFRSEPDIEWIAGTAVPGEAAARVEAFLSARARRPRARR